jgi:hypothetical protein
MFTFVKICTMFNVRVGADAITHKFVNRSWINTMRLRNARRKTKQQKLKNTIIVDCSIAYSPTASNTESMTVSRPENSLPKNIYCSMYIQTNLSRFTEWNCWRQSCRSGMISSRIPLNSIPDPGSGSYCKKDKFLKAFFWAKLNLKFIATKNCVVNLKMLRNFVKISLTYFNFMQ